MATQPQAPFYVPRPPDDQPWTAQPYQMNADAPNYLSASFLLKSRASTAQRQRDYDEGSVWQAQPYQMNADALGMLASQKIFGAPGQVPTKNWVSQYTHDDASLQGVIYQAAPRQSEAIRLTTTQQKLYGQPGQVQAKNWATIHHYDETGPWDARPLHSLTIVVQTTLPIFFGQLGQVPMKQWSPIYCYDDPGVWNEFSVPRSSAVLRPLLTSAGQGATKQWGAIYNYDDSSLWSPGPRNALTFLFPTTLPSEFLGARYWHNYYDEDAGWVRVPHGAGAAIGVPFPIAATRWKYDYDETGPWDARSQRSSIIFYKPPGEPFIAKLWTSAYYDEGGLWVSQSKGQPPITFPNFTAQVKPAFYAPHPPDDQPYVVQPYQLGADIIVILASHSLFGAKGQVITKHWESAYDYDETGPWSPVRLTSGAIAATISQVKFFGQPGQAPAKDWAPQLTYDDPSVWQGTPLDAQSIYLIPAPAPRLPRFWLWDNDDPSTWLAQSVESYLTRYPFTKPVLPNFFEYVDDIAFWQGNPNGYVIRLIGALTPRLPKFWKYNYDETGVWQPAAVQAHLVTLPLPPVSVPEFLNYSCFAYDDGTFYVAQSSQFNADILQQLFLPGQAPAKKWSQWQVYDDSSIYVAQSSQFNADILDILSSAGRPASALWQWDHDNTSWWEGRPSTSPAIARFLTIGGQPPTKRWNQSYTLDDPAFWVGQPRALNLLAKPNFLPFTPPQWQWNYDEGGLYVAQSSQFNADVLDILSSNGSPAAAMWTWDFDDSAPWTPLHALGSISGLHQLLAANKPFFVNLWKQDYDEAAPWLGAPSRSVVLAELLTVGGQPPTRRWESIYDYDDPGPWNEFAAPRSSAVLRPILTAGVPKVPVFWKYDFDEASVWLASPLKSRILATTFPAQTPIRPLQWENPLDDPSLWLASPIASNLPELFAEVTLPLRIRLWRYDFDETGPWPSAPQKIGGVIATHVVTIGNVPFYTEQQWYYTNDDSPPWTVASSGIPPMIRSLTQGGQPPQPKLWKQDLDDASVWLAQPTRPFVLVDLTIGGKPFHKLWTWDFDEGGLWIPKVPTNFQLVNPLLPFGTSIFWKFGQFTQDDSSVWSGQPLLSPTLRPILTTGGQPPTKRWEPILRYDVDASAWETTRRENLILLTTPIPNPVKPRQWRWDHMIDEPLWQKGPTSSWLDMLIVPPLIPVNIDRLLLNYGTRIRTLADNHVRVRLLANTRPRRDET